MAASPDIMIYWGSGSPPCWRVLLVLKEKGLAYKEKLCTFSKKEHKSEEVLALNPRGQLPTTSIDGVVVNESMAACDYLERVYGGQGTRLVPTDRVQMALVLQREYEVLTFIKACSDLIYPLMRTKPEDQNKEDLDQKKKAFLDELKRWEGYLEQGDYIAGKDFSMADVMFYPHVAFLVRLAMPLKDQFPKVAAYYERVTKRPSVKSTWPPHWSDGEGPKSLKDIC